MKESKPIAMLSRTEHSARNTSVAVIARLLAIVLGYATRVVFTRTLAVDYVGVNGLFTDIFSVLSLSELGVQTAITFALYQPVHDGNIEKQQRLMHFYAKFYRGTFAFILLVGLALMPYLPHLMKHPPQVAHLMGIYLIYLINSAISYLFIYKKTLLDAHQLGYIGTLYQMGALLVQNVLQIIVLVITRNFILFLMVALFCTVTGNVLVSRRATRQYPYLGERHVPVLEQQEQQQLWKNIRAMMMHKLGTVAVNNTDNLILSTFVGIAAVGMFSNYFLLLGSVRQILQQLFNGIAASVGNLGVEVQAMQNQTVSSTHMREVFEVAFFVNSWAYGVTTILLFNLLNPFVRISFGANFVLAPPVVMALCLSFYFTGMTSASLLFRDSLGLFWADRFKPVVETFLNLGLSILLTLRFGMIGTFIGTILATLLTGQWIEPMLLYRRVLHAPLRRYFGRYLRYLILFTLAFLLTNVMSGSSLCLDLLSQMKVLSHLLSTLQQSAFYAMMKDSNGVTTFAIRLGLGLLIPNALMWLFFRKCREYAYCVEKARLIVRRLCKKV